MVVLLAAAYSAVADGRAENFGLFLHVSRTLRALFTEMFEARGLELPDMAMDVLLSRLAPVSPSPKASEHIALVAAMLNDYSNIFARHLEYRLATDANNHLEITGGTGSGKSSCALTIANWLSEIEPAKLEAYVNFDLAELPDRLRGKKARETVIQDEFIQVTGEGANTTKALFMNLEDTLRGSGVNLFVLSPRRQEHGTMQATLEAVLWNRAERYTLFLVWIEGRPCGVVAVPWCNESLWRAYSEFKRRNVGRSLSGAFQDRMWAVRNAMRFFANENLVDYLQTVNKGKAFKKTDFEAAIVLFSAEMQTVSQRGLTASFMLGMVANYKRSSKKFYKWFGVEPNDGLRILAGKASAIAEADGEASE